MGKRRSSSHYITLQAQSKGFSMHPLIKENCRLLIRVGRDLNYQRGDLVVFFEKKNLATHRVIGKRSRTKSWEYLLKGDNNEVADGFFDKKDLVGKVEKIYYPDYTIELARVKNRILAYLFVFYSILNMNFNFLLGLRNLYKIKVFKKLYRAWVG